VGKWESWCSRTATGAVVALAKPLIRHGAKDLSAPQRRVSPRGRAHPYIRIFSSPGLSLPLRIRVSRHYLLLIVGLSDVTDATSSADSRRQTACASHGDAMHWHASELSDEA
jgi:hypothetical protein